MPGSNGQGLTANQLPPPRLSMIQCQAYKDMLRELAEAGVPFEEVVRQVRKDYIAAARAMFRGNRCKAAEQIGIHRNTLARHVR